MRRLFALTALALCAAALPARAAVLWSETSENGYPVTHWAKGATVEEVSNLPRAYVGGHSRTLVLCRQTGWFAYVGSQRDFRNGAVCGYATEIAAVYAARQHCELQDGICDLERVGYDTGVPATAITSTSLPVILPGTVGADEPPSTLPDPVEYKHWHMFD